MSLALTSLLQCTRSFFWNRQETKQVNSLIILWWTKKNICSNRQLFDNDCTAIRVNLLKNQFPAPLLDSIFRNFIDKAISPSNIPDEIITVPKKDVSLYLPYLGSTSDNLKKSLKSLVTHAYPQVNLKIIFRTSSRVCNLFKLKDTIPKRLRSNVIYGVYCTGCSDFYIGKTKRHLEKRCKEHLDPRKPSAVGDHLLISGHAISIEDFKILNNGRNDFELLIKESLVIKQLKPPLNAMVSSFPLELF